ncbi:MAG: hypothetical protein DRR19_28275 [Candidatus Parabeggiatoa sp. nov. 1]|nr:MAG: hypothetical protein DRR19_28275 [Gammaproteobacteria bacterium]
MTVKVPRPSKIRLPGNSDSFILLKEGNARLKTDISRLRIEKAQLREENSQLRAENSQFRTENSRLKDELHFTHEELKEERDISEFKDIALAENDALYQILEEERLRFQVE